ncbi:unnamed protein product [Rotaria sordida]|uniref:Multifunctional fusion protein n=1 Tax=Rotaria sordida TaxID=392033 RepID=A0A815HJ84_9BILA|nr:unnamed protein product [Rotaria sordida]CAF4001431.1 unnamed protein product [Rotaria sordida]
MAVIAEKQDRRRVHAQDIVQNFLLIWLDEKIDESMDDYRKSIQKLRCTVNTIQTFRNADECIDYISQLENQKAFVIISGVLCESVVPRIHDISQIYSIYVFCMKKTKYKEWAKNWSKIKDVFIDIDSICDSVRQSARQCDEDSIKITTVSSLNQIEPSFMYTQLFKEIILEINFDDKKEINDLAEYAREKWAYKKYPGDDEQLKIMDEFVREYPCDMNKNNKPVSWYTRESFIYHMLNKALGTLQVETLLKMGMFIRDLHCNIKKLHTEQFQTIQDSSSSPPTTTIKVYRGKTMTKEDFEDKIKQGGLISFNNFLSTTIDRNVAIHFISEGLKSMDKNKIGVLFKMIINHSISSAPFARIDQLSDFPKENEILFSTHTVFSVQRCKHIQENGITIWKVNLTLITDSDDQQLHTLTKQLREEITGTGWQRMGLLLWKMGENDKAEQVYRMLLQQAPDDDNNKAYCYHLIGLIKNNQGQYNVAMEFYEKSLALYEKILPPNHPDLAAFYNNIGSLYYNMGEYSKALSSYERSLEIRKIALPPNHPDVASSYTGIGLVYSNMGEYVKALSSYERSLEIKKIALPPHHPDLAASYLNIGSLYYNMGKYSEALSSYQQSLEIRKIALPPNHPDLASSYTGIGLVYSNMGEYSKALSSYERSLEIKKTALPPNHPDLATSYNNIGMVYDNMGEYSKALSLYERSLEIKKIALPPNHSDLACTYNSIGLIYEKTLEYSKAHSYFEKAQEIWQKSLSPTHWYIAHVNENIDRVKKKL